MTDEDLSQLPQPPGDPDPEPDSQTTTAALPDEGAATAAAQVAEHIKELERQANQLQAEVVRLKSEKQVVEERLEFVEELFGPVEAQRKSFQDQLTAARAAALQAHRNGAPLPVRFVGRLDEMWLRARGLSERDCALLQRGCVTGQDGVSRDVSMLGDPSFKPYHEGSQEPIWEARGGLLRLSLGDVRSRWGEEVALEVMKCAMELDRHDASRRLGVELIWNEAEGREMDTAEVIVLLERELATARTSQRTNSIIPENLADDFSEVSSHNMLDDAGPQDDEEDEEVRQEPRLRPSPTSWIGFETERDALDDSGTVASGIESSPPFSEASSDQHSDYGNVLDRFVEGCHDDWSFADADIEQLLQPMASVCVGGKVVADAPPKLAEEMSEGSLSSGDHFCEDVGEVLREFLEEEVGFGRLCASSFGHGASAGSSRIPPGADNISGCN